MCELHFGMGGCDVSNRRGSGLGSMGRGGGVFISWGGKGGCCRGRCGHMLFISASRDIKMWNNQTLD